MALVALLTLNARPGAQDSRPLPNQDAFVADARRHLHSDRMLLSQYTYTDKQTRFERDSHGAVVKQTVKVFEVHTSVDDDLTYERLVSVDGIPVNRQALERSDHKQAQKEREQAAKLQVETPGDRNKRLEKAAGLRRKEQAAIDEIFVAYSIRMLGRETLDGHSTITFTLEPRPDYQPRTDEGKILKKFRARAWISEDDYEVAKLEIEAIDNVLMGLGFVARLDKGSRGVFERRKINGEIWLPAEERFVGTARILLVRQIKLDQLDEYPEYKKFSVETSTTFQRPAP